jgi:hypothetical protein
MSLQNPASALHATLTTCARCRALTIHALDAPVAALDIYLDPKPLNEIEELTALMSGRMTYDLIPVWGRHEIAHRDQWRIQKREYPVLATHRCPGPIPATAAHAGGPGVPPKTPAPAIPPF